MAVSGKCYLSLTTNRSASQEELLVSLPSCLQGTRSKQRYRVMENPQYHVSERSQDDSFYQQDDSCRKML